MSTVGHIQGPKLTGYIGAWDILLNEAGRDSVFFFSHMLPTDLLFSFAEQVGTHLWGTGCSRIREPVLSIVRINRYRGTDCGTKVKLPG